MSLEIIFLQIRELSYLLSLEMEKVIFLMILGGKLFDGSLFCFCVPLFSSSIFGLVFVCFSNFKMWFDYFGPVCTRFIMDFLFLALFFMNSLKKSEFLKRNMKNEQISSSRWQYLKIVLQWESKNVKKGERGVWGQNFLHFQ